MMSSIKLVIDDDLVFTGRSFGADREAHGEVVFNTGMTGYVETLTDPSYRGQILVLTYPLQGNYGVPDAPYESGRIQVQGLIVAHYSEDPNHHASVKTLSSWFKAEGVPAICGVDTRAITRYLRELGTAPGAIVLEGEKVQSTRVDMGRVLESVVSEDVTHYAGGHTKVLLVDTGSKENICRSLVKRGASVIRSPWNKPWEDYLGEVDGVFLTNGPGDPMDASGLIPRVRRLFNLNLPVFGICFGHQILSLAAGAKTFKLKYGHRSVNQPVRDLLSRRCYITSQNHGYVVQTESLSKEWLPWFENLNDGTNEGIRHATKPIRSVQFHPEACPGPNDTAFLFDEFMTMIKQNKGVAA